ncbi:hypothetical protein NQ117_08435 [Paenibacillus sp. SC116]|uniref:hypothetical protein n=1 Tax=Paenibacillus sp. SC116 TaxID=2968986 RepID=UPI00215A6212|nr:hypothetical protein [Paenibacillus sp. SC116]MCR8843712.1 hypothetical protein [Paenibacillus sp. SC116]
MTESEQPKKTSMANAAKALLAKKKEQQAQGNQGFHGDQSTKALRSQNNKKPNNQRRRTGGS